MLRNLAALGAACALACAPAFALAQAYPQFQGPGGGATPPGMTMVVGSDAVSGAPCLVGLTTTCRLAVVGALGLGGMQAVPAASANGSALGTLPTGALGARFYLGSADSVTFTVAPSAPSSAPAQTYTISGASGGTGPNWDENLSGGQMIYITATSGSPKFRWY